MRVRPDIPLFEGRRNIQHEEELVHLSLVEHLRWRADKRVIWWHTPNELVRTEAQAKKFKAMGGRAGVYDFAFIMPREVGVPSDRIIFGVPSFLELKVAGGIVSKEQLRFAADCDAIGIENAIAWNIDQAVAILQAWGILPE